jgi:hypothetical protein
MITTHQKLVNALEAMPVKELRVGKMRDEHGCMCALGVMLHAAGVNRRDMPLGPMGAQRAIGGDHAELSAIMCANDDFKGTREERHAHMLAYGKARA